MSGSGERPLRAMGIRGWLAHLLRSAAFLLERRRAGESTGNDPMERTMAALRRRYPDAPEHWRRFIAERMAPQDVAEPASEGGNTRAHETSKATHPGVRQLPAARWPVGAAVKPADAAAEFGGDQRQCSEDPGHSGNSRPTAKSPSVPGRMPGTGQAAARVPIALPRFLPQVVPGSQPMKQSDIGLRTSPGVRRVMPRFYPETRHAAPQAPGQIEPAPALRSPARWPVRSEGSMPHGRQHPAPPDSHPTAALRPPARWPTRSESSMPRHRQRHAPLGSHPAAEFESVLGTCGGEAATVAAPSAFRGVTGGSSPDHRNRAASSTGTISNTDSGTAAGTRESAFAPDEPKWPELPRPANALHWPEREPGVCAWPWDESEEPERWNGLRF